MLSFQIKRKIWKAFDNLHEDVKIMHDIVCAEFHEDQFCIIKCRYTDVSVTVNKEELQELMMKYAPKKAKVFFLDLS